MDYIGINYDGCHDSSVCYYTDKLIFSASEERFSRIKKDGRPPVNALAYLYDNFDINFDNTEFAFPILDAEMSHEAFYSLGKNDYFDWLPFYESSHKPRKNAVDYAFAQAKNPPRFVPHNRAHAASAYFLSGVSEPCLVITMDAGNFFDPYSITISEGRNGRLTLMEAIPDRSIAQNYLIVTGALGYKPLEHEGKITGLASYGTLNSELVSELEHTLALVEDIELTSWTNISSHDLVPRISMNDNVRIFDDILKKYEPKDIAYAIQYITEKRVISIVSRHKASYKHIALAGGLFANVTLNKKILDLGFDSIYIHPAMGDDGLALGAVLEAKAIDEGSLSPIRLPHAYAGPEFSAEDVQRLCEEYGFKFHLSDNIELEIASLLFDDNVVARFEGRCEYGPRALGNRSILYKADDSSVNQWLNERLRRTEFMPFAPIVREEDAELLFVNTKPARYTGQFMTITFECTETMKAKAPAAVHVDGTARPQFVTADNSPKVYKILDEYNKLSGGNSFLINTSFNMHGEPIVLTPADAFRSFDASDLDYLAINDYIIQKK
jgi:carbamoyltransferase